MFKSFDRKKIMLILDKLIEKKYGSYNDLIQLTIQEITDILKVLESKKQEQQINGIGL